MTPPSEATGQARIRQICEAAARGSFPPADWRVTFAAPPAGLRAAVLAFTGQHVIAADLDEKEIRSRFDPGDLAAPFNPTFLAWLGERLGACVGHVDVTLARRGGGGRRPRLKEVAHPPEVEQVQRARRLRSDVVFLAPPEGGAVVALGRGLVGRRELSVAVTDEARRARGVGTRVVRNAVAMVAADEVVFASVAPGNGRSLRCLLRARFTPIGAECLFPSP